MLSLSPCRKSAVRTLAAVAVTCLLSAILPISTPPFLFGQGQKPDENLRARFEYYMSGLKKHRLVLDSGVFRAYGVRQTKTWSRKIELFCAFDFTAHKLRFDRREGKKGGDGFTEYKYIQTEKNKIICQENGAGIAVLPIDSPVRSKSVPFDVRTLGIANYGDLLNFAGFDDLHAAMAKNAPLKVTTTEEGLTRIESESPGQVISDLWLNEKAGFTIIRKENWTTDAETGQRDKEGTSDVTWLQKSGVWVPKSFRLWHSLVTDELSFEWESVNEPVPEILFTPKGFDVKSKGITTPVVDFSLEKPIVIEQLAAGAPRKEKNEEGRIWQLTAAATASIALVAGFSLTIIWLRRKRRAPS